MISKNDYNTTFKISRKHTIVVGNFVLGIKVIKRNTQLVSGIFDKKILIVDDQSFNIEALLIILKYNLGLDSKLYCESALSGEQALKMIS